MSDRRELTAELDRLLGFLEGAGTEAETPGEAGRAAQGRPKSAAGRDAIDAALAAAGRETQVRSLREAPEIEAFRRELIDGLIRVDTANQLLRLVNEVVTRVLR